MKFVGTIHHQLLRIEMRNDTRKVADIPIFLTRNFFLVLNPIETLHVRTPCCLFLGHVYKHNGPKYNAHLLAKILQAELIVLCDMEDDEVNVERRQKKNYKKKMSTEQRI